MVFSSKEIDSHDTKNQPEDETDQQDIEDGRNGSQQGIHHHL